MFTTIHGKNLEDELKHYGLKVEQVEEFLNRDNEFVLRTGYNTILKVTKKGDTVQLTPYFEEKEEVLKYVYINKKLCPISEKAKTLINPKTGFLDLELLKIKGLDYYIDCKEDITIVGVIKKFDEYKFPSIIQFKEDLKKFEKENENSDLTLFNYLSVIKTHEDHSHKELTEKLNEIRSTELVVYQTGRSEFTVLSKFPLSSTLVGGLPVSIRFCYLDTFKEQDILTKRLNLLKQLQIDSLNEEDLIIKAYIRALHNKTDETVEHSERLKKIATILGEELLIPDSDYGDLWRMCIIHDIGKLAIEGKVINKPSKLTDAEFDIVKKHTILGYEMLNGLKSYENCREVCLHHHERWDGKGYPHGLKGTEIPLLIRIISVADPLDAMASRRVYKDKCSKEYIRNELIKNQGTQFCPQVSRVALLKLDEIFKIYEEC